MHALWAQPQCDVLMQKCIARIFTFNNNIITINNNTST